jgi:CheY-like chemotaxis protein
MNHTVLLADDSLTIQKVIKITLANQPYDIVDCSSEDELFQKLTKVQPKVVFLDFNLSEKYTGYELTTKIKSVSPSTKVLLLLGTFDTVDDAAMEKAGASEKIVKPFDSNKFIAICKQLVDSAGAEEIQYPDIKEKPIRPVIPQMEEDQWQVSHTTDHHLSVATPDKTGPFELNKLAKEISEWGFNVPGIISGDSKVESPSELLPPVIGDAKPAVEKVKTRSEIFETKFPDNNDLDYPMMDEPAKPHLEVVPNQQSKPHSKLIPIETLKQVDDFEIEHGINSEPETDIKSIEDQIKDEVEDNLWQVDEFEELKKEVSSKMDEMKNTFHPSRNDFDESLFKPLDEKEVQAWSDSTSELFGHTQDMAKSHQVPAEITADLRSEMEAMVKKYVQQYMDEMFKKNVEKIAWEVIPDLAENLIRQELGKIANKILNESNN